MGNHSDTGIKRDEPVALVRATAIAGASQFAILVIGLVVAISFFPKSSSASVVLFIGTIMVSQPRRRYAGCECRALHP